MCLMASKVFLVSGKFLRKTQKMDFYKKVMALDNEKKPSLMDQDNGVLPTS